MKKYQYKPTKKRDATHKLTTSAYGAKIQCKKEEPDELLLDKLRPMFMQSVTGSFLYYGQAVNSSMLVAFNEIGIQQTYPTPSKPNKSGIFNELYSIPHPDTLPCH